MLKHFYLRFYLICSMFFAFPFMANAETIGIFYDSQVGQISFAASDIKTALEAKGFTVEMLPLADLTGSYSNKKVVLALSSNSAVTALLTAQGGSIVTGLSEQGYGLRTTTQGQTSFWVLGGDSNGAMYGGIQMAENINFFGFTGTYNNQESASIARRGIKLNLAYDIKSATYGKTFDGTSQSFAVKEMWDLNFWKEWFDEMARNRYNTVSIWSNHPFTSMIKMPDYLDVALQNITDGRGFTKVMSIDEKIVFWKAVMAYAHNRGFEFYLFNWNIWTGTAGGKYGIVPDNLRTAATDPATITYMRKCMAKLLETYEDLDGFGITQGEHMSDNETDNALFLAKTYGEGAIDYAKSNPTRKFRFIHRWFLADFVEIRKNFAGLLNYPSISFDMSFKYCIGHMYSGPAPGFMTTEDKQALISSDMRSFLTIRNDDFYYQDWGDPRFVREFIKNIPGRMGTTPQEKWFQGFFMGADGYTPMRTFFSKNSVSQGKLEVQRQWYMFKLWGRLGYNPQTSDEVFKNHMAFKYPGISAETLFQAWSKASSGIPKFTELIQTKFRGDDDWTPENCQDLRTGFVTANMISEAGKQPGSTLCSIANTAANNCNGAKSSYTVADEMEKEAKEALSLISSMSAAENTELGVTINNIKTLSYLTIYYAYKLRGATNIKANKLTEAKVALGEAYCWWIRYTDLMNSMYTGMKMTRSKEITNFKMYDSAALKEYTDLGGVGTPNCTVLSVVKIDSDANNGITIYPIPTSDKLFVSANGKKINKLQLIDSNGKEVYTSTYFDEKKGIDITHLSKGLYIVKIDDSLGNSYTSKIIVQ